jgi:uncharacterized protein
VLRSEEIAFLREKAEQGDAKSQNDLGMLLSGHESADRDEAEAVHWFRKAAIHGRADAQFNLSVMYAAGDGIERDDFEALNWARKAADQGLLVAQGAVGTFYFWGLKVGSKHKEPNYNEAYFWLTLAAKGPNNTTASLLLRASMNLTPEEKAEVEKRVADWKPTPSQPPASA